MFSLLLPLPCRLGGCASARGCPKHGRRRRLCSQRGRPISDGVDVSLVSSCNFRKYSGTPGAWFAGLALIPPVGAPARAGAAPGGCGACPAVGLLGPGCSAACGSKVSRLTKQRASVAEKTEMRETPAATPPWLPVVEAWRLPSPALLRWTPWLSRCMRPLGPSAGRFEGQERDKRPPDALPSSKADQRCCRSSEEAACKSPFHSTAWQVPLPSACPDENLAS